MLSLVEEKLQFFKIPQSFTDHINRYLFLLLLYLVVFEFTFGQGDIDASGRRFRYHIVIWSGPVVAFGGCGPLTVVDRSGPLNHSPLGSCFGVGVCFGVANFLILADPWSGSSHLFGHSDWNHFADLFLLGAATLLIESTAGTSRITNGLLNLLTSGVWGQIGLLIWTNGRRLVVVSSAR